MFRSFLERLRFFGEAIVSAFSSVFWFFEGASEVPRQIIRALGQVLRGLLWVLKSPVMIVRWIGRLGSDVGAGGRAVAHSVESTRRSLSESAASVRETVEQQPFKLQTTFIHGIRSFRSWYWNQAIWYRILFTVFSGIVLLSLASAYPAWIYLKKWRADNLIAQAEAYFAQGRSYQAFLKGQAAYYVDSDNPKILSNLIEYSRSVRHPNTLQYGQELIAKGGVTAGALRSLAEEAQRTKATDLARAYLRRLENIDPNNDDILRLRIELYVLEGKRQEAYELAKIGILKDSGAEIFGHYASLGLELEEGEARHKLVDSLWDELDSNDKRSLYAALLLVRESTVLSVEQVDLVTSHILENSFSDRTQKLRAYFSRINVGLTTIRELRGDMRQLFDFSLKTDRFQYAYWLYNSQFFEEILYTFQTQDVADDATLFSIYALAMIETNAKERALDLLRSSDAFVLSEIERLILEAQAQRSLGRMQAYVSTVERAIARAEVKDFRTLEGYLERLNNGDFLNSFYEKFINFPGTAAEADSKRILSAYDVGDNETLERILKRQRIESLRNFPPAQSLFAYLRGLKAEGVLENIRELEALVAKYPSVVDFRISLALNYFQEGYLREASEVLNGVVSKGLEEVPGMLAVYENLKWTTSSRFGEANPELDKFTELPMLDIERDFLESLKALRGY